MRKKILLLSIMALILCALIGVSVTADNSEPSVEIAYYTVPMRATVSILYAVPAANYEVNSDGTVDDLYLLVWKGAEGTVDEAERVQSSGVLNINGAPHLIFSYDGLSASQMDVKAYARVSYGDRLGTTKSYSVKDFADTYDGEHKALVASMIKYGNSVKALAEVPVDAEAEIVNKNGAKGVLTLISDDGDQRTSDFFYTEMQTEYNTFKITIALPTKYVATLSKTADGKAWLMDEDGNYVLTVLNNKYTSIIENSVFANTSDYPTMVDFWKKVTDTGAIEVASHSHTHAAWGLTDEITYKDDGSIQYPAGNVIKELHASAQILRELIGQDTPFILRPGGHTDLTSDYFYALVESDDTFLGMRTSNGAPPLPGAVDANKAKLNSVAKFQKKDQRLKIATILVRSYEAAFNADGTGFATDSTSTKEGVLAAGISAWTQYVDYAMQYNSWASIGFHSVVADTATASGYQVYDSQVKALMDYVEPLVESGELWLPSFAEASKYYFEWSSATLEAKSYGDSCIKVKLIDEEEDERFDEPLTVKVKIPSSWGSCIAERPSSTETLAVRTDDGGSFVYVNIVPGSDIVTLAPAQ